MNDYKNSTAYKLNTRWIGGISFSAGTITAIIGFITIFTNKDFVISLLNGDKPSEASAIVALAILLISLVGSWIGRNPKIPDDPEPPTAGVGPQTSKGA